MSSDTATLDTIRSAMKDRGVEFIFAQFVDLYGRPSAKLIPAANLDGLVEEGAGFAGFAAGEIGQLPSDPDIGSATGHPQGPARKGPSFPPPFRPPCRAACEWKRVWLASSPA